MPIRACCGASRSPTPARTPLWLDVIDLRPRRPAFPAALGPFERLVSPTVAAAARARRRAAPRWPGRRAELSPRPRRQRRAGWRSSATATSPGALPARSRPMTTSRRPCSVRLASPRSSTWSRRAFGARPLHQRHVRRHWRPRPRGRRGRRLPVAARAVQRGGSAAELGGALAAPDGPMRRGGRWRPAQTRATDWAYLQFVDLRRPDPLADYAEAAARENEARVPAHTPVGWCSWYHYFDRVTEQDISPTSTRWCASATPCRWTSSNLDDGFQAQVGDWFETKPTFPHGLRWLAARIRGHDLTPGLWLAPYIVRSDARLLREHPDWFLRDAQRPACASAGFNWARWCYALDPTHPEVRAHVHRLIQTAVQEWGFPYLKLDFLYAAALPGQALRSDSHPRPGHAPGPQRHPRRRRARHLSAGLRLPAGFGGRAGGRDARRAPTWRPIGTRHLLHAPLWRRCFSARWISSACATRCATPSTARRCTAAGGSTTPTACWCATTTPNLTEAEVRSLATVIALSGGMFLVSDEMHRLPPERQHYIAALLPVLGDFRARRRAGSTARCPTCWCCRWRGRWATGWWPACSTGPAARAAARSTWRALGLQPGGRILRIRVLGPKNLASACRSSRWVGPAAAAWRAAAGAAPPLRRARRWWHLPSTSRRAPKSKPGRWMAPGLTFGLALGRRAEGRAGPGPARPHRAWPRWTGRPFVRIGTRTGLYRLNFRSTTRRRHSSRMVSAF